MYARAKTEHQNGAVLHNTLACVQIYGTKEVNRGQQLSMNAESVE